METHVRVAAWLRIVWSAFGLLVGVLIGLSFQQTVVQLTREILQSSGQTAGQGDMEAVLANMGPMLATMGTVLLVVFVLAGLAGLATGWGLLAFRPWARGLNIALSILDLISIPIGTAIGAYSLWVMLNRETAEMFRAGQPPGRYPAHF